MKFLSPCEKKRFGWRVKVGVTKLGEISPLGRNLLKVSDNF